MNENCCGCCPGCKRRCTAEHPRCKYGQKYFASCCANEKKESLDKKTKKQSLARQFIKTARRMKKALKKKKYTEEQMLGVLGDQDREVLSLILKKLNEKAVSN